MRSTLILQDLLAIDSVRLWRLVTDINDPGSNFHDDEILLNLRDPGDVAVKSTKNGKEIIESSLDVKLHAILVKILTAGLHGESQKLASLQARRAYTNQLLNSDQKFEEIARNPEAQKWVEKAIRRGRDAYMIVGFRSVFDATLRDQDMHGAGAEASGKASIVPNTTAELELGGSTDKSKKKRSDGVAENEQVYAIQYRKVRFQLFSSKELAKGWL